VITYHDLLKSEFRKWLLFLSWVLHFWSLSGTSIYSA